MHKILKHHKSFHFKFFRGICTPFYSTKTNLIKKQIELNTNVMQQVKEGNIENAINLLQKAPKDEVLIFHYNSLFSELSVSGQLETMKSTFDKMKRANILPDFITYY